MLFLHLQDDGAETADWLLIDRQGQRRAGGQATPLETIAAEDGARVERACVLAPTRLFTLTEVELPMRRRRQAMAAIPYTIEDRLAQEIEDCHFAYGPVGEGGRTPVIVAARAQMQAWLDRLEQAGLWAGVLTPDLFMLPYQEGAWAAMLSGDRLLLRSGARAGLEVPGALARPMLDRVREEQAPQQTVMLQLWTDRQSAETDWADLSGFAVTVTGASEELLGDFAAHYRPGDVLNLLQGPYAPRDRGGFDWRRWRAAAAVALLWLTAEVTLVMADLRSLHAEQDRIEARIEQVFRQAMPAARGVQDAQEARARMQVALDSLRGGGGSAQGDLLELVATAAPVISAYPEATVNRLSYRDRALAVDLTLPTLQAVEDLRARLQGAGVSAQVETASSQEGVVSGRLRIGGGAT
jgi:general secretion pathway protein L